MHGAAVIGLTQVDVRLTTTQHLATFEQKSSTRRRLQQLNEIEEELRTQNLTLHKADELALKVMKECHPDDVATISSAGGRVSAAMERHNRESGFVESGNRGTGEVGG